MPVHPAFEASNTPSIAQGVSNWASRKPTGVTVDVDVFVGVAVLVGDRVRVGVAVGLLGVAVAGTEMSGVGAVDMSLPI